MRGAHSRPSRPRRATAACGDTACAEACGMWHGVVSGGCVGRGGGEPWRNRGVWPPGVRVGGRDGSYGRGRAAIRHAPRRAACDTVVSRVEVGRPVCASSPHTGPSRHAGMVYLRLPQQLRHTAQRLPLSSVPRQRTVGRRKSRPTVATEILLRRQVVIRRAPSRAVCGTVVSRVAVRGAVGVVRAVAACGLRVCAWAVATDHAVEVSGDTPHAE